MFNSISAVLCGSFLLCVCVCGVGWIKCSCYEHTSVIQVCMKISELRIYFFWTCLRRSCGTRFGPRTPLDRWMLPPRHGSWRPIAISTPRWLRSSYVESYFNIALVSWLFSPRWRLGMRRCLDVHRSGCGSLIGSTCLGTGP